MISSYRSTSYRVFKAAACCQQIIAVIKYSARVIQISVAPDTLLRKESIRLLLRISVILLYFSDHCLSL